MKKSGLITQLFLLLLTCIGADVYGQHNTLDLTGAWQKGPDDNRIVWINSEKHFSASVYNIKEKKFLGTCGGIWKVEGNTLVEIYEFNTMDPGQIGQDVRNEIEMKGGKLIIRAEGGNEEWTRVDNGSPGKLAGAWVITGRVHAEGVQKKTPGARKTLKILSATRFQWIAYGLPAAAAPWRRSITTSRSGTNRRTSPR